MTKPSPASPTIARIQQFPPLVWDLEDSGSSNVLITFDATIVTFGDPRLFNGKESSSLYKAPQRATKRGATRKKQIQQSRGTNENGPCQQELSAVPLGSAADPTDLSSIFPGAVAVQGMAHSVESSLNRDQGEWSGSNHNDRSVEEGLGTGDYFHSDQQAPALILAARLVPNSRRTLGF